MLKSNYAFSFVSSCISRVNFNSKNSYLSKSHFVFFWPAEPEPIAVVHLELAELSRVPPSLMLLKVSPGFISVSLKNTEHDLRSAWTTGQMDMRLQPSDMSAIVCCLFSLRELVLKKVCGKSTNISSQIG